MSTGRRGPRVGLLAARSRLERPGHLVPTFAHRLRVRGVDVVIVDPDHEAVPLHRALGDGVDLWILMSGGEAALSLAGALEACGASLLSPYAASAGCRDKIVQTALLTRAGLPVPESWLTVDPDELAAELERGPLLCKDPRGSRGRGLHLVRDRVHLRALPTGTPWLVMRYHQPEGPDMKLYRIGEAVHGVSRTFPAVTLAEKLGRPLPVTPELRSLVMRCSDAFGVDVCGVDVIRSGDGLWVVDMSSFPGFKGVPQAPQRLAELVLDRLGVPVLQQADR